jgi:NDP-mannose synthase
LKAVILAGGLGKRLRPFTEAIPKPLLPVGEKAILEIQIENFKKYGFDEIYLATNYKSDYLKNFFGDGSKFGVKLQISKEKIPLGTAGPLMLLKDKLNEPFIVMNGDILSLIDFSKFFTFASNSKSDLTIAIKKEITPYRFGNIFFKGDYVTKIEEKPNLETNILAGIYAMKPSVFSLFPENEYFGMDQLIHKMLELDKPIMKYEMKEYWLDIGRPEDYNEAQKDYHKHFK